MAPTQAEPASGLLSRETLTDLARLPDESQSREKDAGILQQIDFSDFPPWASLGVASGATMWMYRLGMAWHDRGTVEVFLPPRAKVLPENMRMGYRNTQVLKEALGAAGRAGRLGLGASGTYFFTLDKLRHWHSDPAAGAVGAVGAAQQHQQQQGTALSHQELPTHARQEQQEQSGQQQDVASMNAQQQQHPQWQQQKQEWWDYPVAGLAMGTVASLLFGMSQAPALLKRGPLLGVAGGAALGACLEVQKAWAGIDVVRDGLSLRGSWQQRSEQSA